MILEKPYLLFVGDAPDELAAKTAFGVLEWRPGDCVGQFALPDCKANLNISRLSIAEAKQSGAKTVVIGVANRGGVIPQSWIEPIVEALKHDMSIANGLHTSMDSISQIRDAATASHGNLIEVRRPSGPFRIATGEPRSGHRLLAVGTDCSVGKMYSTLSIAEAMQKRGMPCDFRATGQTGIFIEGSGIPVDAVVADFISGSIEDLCPAADSSHWDIIEGQGSLHHPSFAGVSLGLLHGAQPDYLVLCHEPTRTHMRGLPDRPLPLLRESMETNLAAARIVQPNVQFAGISINTKHLPKSEALSYLAKLEEEHQLPCVDPFVTGTDRIVDRLESGN